MSLIGQTLQDRYYISHQIGEGGMGRVYYAEDIRLNQVVAIKETLNPSNEPVQQMDARIKAFKREAHLLAGKIKHQAIPRVSDYFPLGENWYIVMDYVEGDSLETQLARKGGPFSIEEVLLWTNQLLEILDSLHSGIPSIIHRDIKPSNIKVKNDKVYLLDFGLARQLTGSKTSIPLITPAYSSPEQLENKEPTAKSDLYSVGATMYCLLTNTVPISAFSRSFAIASGGTDPLQHIKELRADLPNKLADLIMSALSIKPEERPSSAKTMQRELHCFLVEKDITPTLSSYDFLEKNKTLSLPSHNVSSDAGNIDAKIENSDSIGEDEIRPPASDRSLISTPSDSSKNQARNWKKVIAGFALVIVLGLLGFGIYKYATKPQIPPAPTKSPRQIATEKTEQAMEMLYISDYEKVKALSKEAIDSDPTYSLAHAVYGDALWDTEETELEDPSGNMGSQISKVEIFKIFNSKEPSTEEDFAARAWAFLVDKKWDRAKQDIEKVIAQKPEWAWALMVKASVAISTGCVEKNSKEILEAINTLKRITSLQPKYAVAYINLGGSYKCNGQNQDALDAYGQAINVRPIPSFYLRRGNFYLDSIEKKTKDKNIENAQKDYEESLKIDPEFSEAYIGLARIHEAKEKYEDCIKEAERALKKPSFHAYRQMTTCRTALASKEKDEKGFDEALANIERAKEERNKYRNPIEQQNALAHYYYLKAYIYNSKAFYFLTEKYLKKRISNNKNKVNAELNNALSAIKQARDINHDKDSEKEYEKLQKQVEENIRIFKRY